MAYLRAQHGHVTILSDLIGSADVPVGVVPRIPRPSFRVLVMKWDRLSSPCLKRLRHWSHPLHTAQRIVGRR